MDKIILIFYINTYRKSKCDVVEVLDRVSEYVKDNGCVNYVFPIFEGDSYVDCVNPKLISADEYTKIQEIIDTNKEIVSDCLKKYNKEYEN